MNPPARAALLAAALPFALPLALAAPTEGDASGRSTLDTRGARGAALPGAWLVCGDLDRDGCDDVVIADGDAGVLTIRRGSPSGLVAESTTEPMFGASDEVLLVDASSDGILDLVERGSTSVLIRVGNGDGTFGALHVLPLPSFVSAVACADVDGDGWIDVVAALPNDLDVVTLAGTGVGDWSTARRVTSFGHAVNHLALADLDGDGVLDLAAAVDASASRAHVRVAFGLGDGTFAPSVGAGGLGAGSRGASTRVAVTDVDGDGDLDLAVRTADPARLVVHANSGVGTFFEALELPWWASGAGDPLFADVDGDARVEVAEVGDAAIRFHSIAAAGDVVRGFQIECREGTRQVRAADVDGDGHCEILVLAESRHVVQVHDGRPLR